MDRQGYDTGNVGYTTGAGNHGKPIGQQIKEAIPGTHEYQATHGTTGAHSSVEQMKSYVPGTEEHRMREAGVIGSGGHHHTTGTGYTGTGHTGPSMGERIAGSIPGTGQYEATHGMTGAHRTVEQAKAHIPGTEEHRLREGVQGTGGGIMGTGTGYNSHEAHGHTAGSYESGYGSHDVTGTGVGGHQGVGVGEHKSLGQKVKEAIPGTHEHEAKKMEQGRY